MCFNTTVLAFMVVCCPNGTFLPGINVWTSAKSSFCGDMNQPETTFNWWVVGLLFVCALAAMILLRMIICYYLFREGLRNVFGADERNGNGTQNLNANLPADLTEETIV